MGSKVVEFSIPDSSYLTVKDSDPGVLANPQLYGMFGSATMGQLTFKGNAGFSMVMISELETVVVWATSVA